MTSEPGVAVPDQSGLNGRTQSPSPARPRGFWMSVSNRPRRKIETVPVDWETQRAMAWVDGDGGGGFVAGPEALG